MQNKIIIKASLILALIISYIVQPQVAYANKAPESLWDELSIHCKMQQYYNNLQVTRFASHYHKNPTHLKQLSNRANPYLYFIIQELKKLNLPGELALVPMIESSFIPTAHSHMGAAGLWQLQNATANIYGLEQTQYIDPRLDVEKSTIAALNYLKDLNEKFHGDWLLTLAAYNAGGGRVSQAIKKNRALGKSTHFWALDLPEETKNFVPKILAMAKIVTAPTKAKSLDDIDNRQYCSSVKIYDIVDLKHIAHIAQVGITEMRLLNPAFKQDKFKKYGEYKILLPIKNANIFRKHLQQNTDNNWKINKNKIIIKHIVQKDETLHIIAKKYRISLATLIEKNNLKNNLLTRGQVILI